MPPIRTYLNDLGYSMLADRICNGNNLRASKPPIDFTFVRVEDSSKFMGYHHEYRNAEHRKQAEAAYIWRMLAFYISPKSQHKCLPVMAEYDLANSDETKALDKIVEDILNVLPKSYILGTLLTWGGLS